MRSGDLLQSGNGVREHLGHLPGGLGTTEQINLHLGASFAPELFELSLGLDALGHDCHMQPGA